MKLFYLITLYLFVGQCFSRNSVQFCDKNSIDAVLWDGFAYRLTRDQWITTYDPRFRTVGQFSDIRDFHFPNEKGLYYQSVYHIPTVPECGQSEGCRMISQLSGLTIYTIVRQNPSDSKRIDVFNRLAHNGKRTPVSMKELKEFVENNILPKGKTPQRYRPSVYSPKDYTFIHITNRYGDSEPIMQTIELKSGEDIKKSYYVLNHYKHLIFVTSFWWTYDQNVYVIGQLKKGFGQQFVYRLNRNEEGVYSITPLNMTVLQFFHCPQPTRTPINEIIDQLSNQISEQVLVTTPRPGQMRTQEKVITSTTVYHEVIAQTNNGFDAQTTKQMENDEEVTTFLNEPSFLVDSSTRSMTDEYEKRDNQEQSKSDDKIVVESLTEFWKIFPTVIMFSLIAISLLILIIGFFMVKNLNRFLSSNVVSKTWTKPTKVKSLEGLRTQRMRLSDDMNDLFVDDFYSCESTSAKTLDSVRTTNVKSLQ